MHFQQPPIYSSRLAGALRSLREARERLSVELRTPGCSLAASSSTPRRPRRRSRRSAGCFTGTVTLWTIGDFGHLGRPAGSPFMS